MLNYLWLMLALSDSGTVRESAPAGYRGVVTRTGRPWSSDRQGLLAVPLADDAASGYAPVSSQVHYSCKVRFRPKADLSEIGEEDGVVLRSVRSSMGPP